MLRPDSNDDMRKEMVCIHYHCRTFKFCPVEGTASGGNEMEGRGAVLSREIQELSFRVESVSSSSQAREMIETKRQGWDWGRVCRG